MATQVSLLLYWKCPFENERALERSPTPTGVTSYFADCRESTRLGTDGTSEGRDDTKPGNKDEDMTLGPPPPLNPPFL